jgi:hypothetical protein
MPAWAWVLDGAGVLLGLVLVYAVCLVVRRRLIARHGGTFELSHRVRTARSGRGWLLGIGRYTGERLEWFRIFSLSPRPKRSWARADLTYVGRREAEGAEQVSLFPEHIVISCDTPSGPIELAMGPSALTGFQAWLEARPPGAEMPGSRGRRP